ncbi:unnamed protein product [Choristocarpus tenellus]
MIDCGEMSKGLLPVPHLLSPTGRKLVVCVEIVHLTPVASSFFLPNKDTRRYLPKKGTSWLETATKMASPTTQKRLKQGPSGVISCLAYSACSISMVLGNKALATYGVDVHLLPVVFQCFFAMVMTKLLSAVGIPGLHAEAMNLKTAVSWLPINVLFCSMLFTSFMALKWIEIPMFQVFKTSTVVWVTILEFLLFGGKVNAHCCAALTLIVVGAAGTVVTGIDLRNGWGLFWMVANVFSTASYIIYLKFATRFIKLSRLGMVKYNNTLGVLLLAPAVLAKGEVSSLLESGALKSWQYVGLNLLVGVVGFGINLVALWCIECTSASTYSITGNLSKVHIARARVPGESILKRVRVFCPVLSKKNWAWVAAGFLRHFTYHSEMSRNRQHVHVMKRRHQNKDIDTSLTNTI